MSVAGLTASPWLWLTVGVALAAAETVLSGVYLLWIGAAAASVGLVLLAFPDLSLSAQLLLLAILAIGFTFLGHRFYRRIAHTDRPHLNRRGEQYLGRRLVLDEAIRNGTGHVRLGDGVWRVRGPDLPAGAAVRVVGTEDTLLIVMPDTP
jgi:membrane protein implicated in regulation of membrane protease activity